MLASIVTERRSSFALIIAIGFALTSLTTASSPSIQKKSPENTTSPSIKLQDLSSATRKSTAEPDPKSPMSTNSSRTRSSPASSFGSATQNNRLQVDLSTPTNTTTSKSPGLIMRTSDAIYRALTGYFSHDDEEIDDGRKDFGAKLTTTGLKSSPAGERSTATTPYTNSMHLPTTSSSTAPPVRLEPATSSHTTRARTSAISTTGKPHLGTTTGHHVHPMHHEILPLKPTHTSTSGTPHSPTPKPLKELGAVDGRARESTTSNTISTTTENSKLKMTSAPHLNLEFSDHIDETHPADRISSTTRKLRPDTRMTTPSHETTSISSHQAQQTIVTPSTAASATTWKPKPKTTIAPIRISSSPPIAPKANDLAATQIENVHSGTSNTSLLASIHLFSLLDRAFTSIRSELMFLNRTTRLARGQIQEGLEESTAMQVERETDIEVPELNPIETKPSGRLTNSSRTADGASGQSVTSNGQQVTSREDIMLLCKLLHKHLEAGWPNNASIALNLRGLTENVSQPTAGNASRWAVNETSTSTAAPIKVNALDLDADGVDNEDRKWLLSEPRTELSDQVHGDRLLETVFSLEPPPRSSVSSELNPGELGQNGSVYEEAGIRLLTDLFNLGYRKKLSSIRFGVDEQEVGSSADFSRNVSVRVWSKTLVGGHSGKLKLVYWLLESTVDLAHTRSSGPRRFKVLEFAEAQELIDQLDHSLVQRVINDVTLVRPKGMLVAAHKGQLDPGDQLLLTPPRVIDDQLVSPGHNNGSQTPILQLFVERLTSSSFSEHLYLYLLLAVVIIFIIVMCFAVPALCCKCMVSSAQSRHPDVTSSVMDGHRRGGRRMRSQSNPKSRRQQPPPKGFYRSMDPLRESITSISQSLAANGDAAESNGLKSIDNPAIWRKLSNSTTTMTKDEIRTLENDGQFELACDVDDESRFISASKMSPTKSKFEWYTFEDNKEQTIRRQNVEPPAKASLSKQRGQLINKPTQTKMLVRDQTKVTKSVQTYALDEDSSEFAPDSASGTPLKDEHLSLAYRDRLETRNSNTLTKSELVMLREKLIPIGSHVPKHEDCRKVQQQQPTINHDYVNTTADNQHDNRPRTATRGPSRHIDSSSVDSVNGGHARKQQTSSAPGVDEESRGRASNISERAPTMRYLELPVQTQSKVDAIKQELAKVEERDSTNISSRPRRADSNKPYSDIVGTYRRYDVI